MRVFVKKLRCKIYGHPVPSKNSEFMTPIRQAKPDVDLPYLTLPCPRCGASLRLPFLPGTRGMDTPVHHVAMQRWQNERRHTETPREE